ncbi:CHASE3 domain-containing protein [Mesorhizobium australicum]|uniref:CHASE3 domain-containing protein n=1 Tax=Mesorhizobium australicum TaxID=536018 RepID=UPI0033360DB1
MQALRTLLTSYPDSQSTLQRLTAIIVAKFGEFDQTIALKRDQRDAEVEALFRTNRGKALTDEANVFFSGVIGRADDRLHPVSPSSVPTADGCGLFLRSEGSSSSPSLPGLPMQPLVTQENFARHATRSMLSTATWNYVSAPEPKIWQRPAIGQRCF